MGRVGECGELGFKYVKSEMSVRHPSGGSGSKLKRRIRNQGGPKIEAKRNCAYFIPKTDDTDFLIFLFF